MGYIRITGKDDHVEIHTHMKIASLKRHSKHLVVGKAYHIDDGHLLTFSLIGHENVDKLLDEFKDGDLINIVTEGGVVVKLSKSIDVEA